MIQLILIKHIQGFYTRSSTLFVGEGRSWRLLYPLLSEIWGNEWSIKHLQKFLNQKELEDNYDCTGFNDVTIEDNADGFIVVTYEWSEGYELHFPKEKFKEFVSLVGSTAQKVCSKSIHESPDLLQFIINDDWNTRIEQVYLNADISFFEKDGSGMPQFRFERVKEYQYKLVQNDCVSDPISKTLGMFVEDVWTLNKEQSPALELLREKESGRFDYQRTYFEKNGDTVRLMRKDEVTNNALTLTADQMYRVIVLTRQFCRNLHDAPLDKLPGVIFFTFDEYWNLIPVPLFRPTDKKFKE